MAFGSIDRHQDSVILARSSSIPHRIIHHTTAPLSCHCGLFPTLHAVAREPCLQGFCSCGGKVGIWPSDASLTMVAVPSMEEAKTCFGLYSCVSPKWKQLFWRIRAETRKICRTRKSFPPSHLHYDSFNYAMNFDDEGTRFQYHPSHGTALNNGMGCYKPQQD